MSSNKETGIDKEAYQDQEITLKDILKISQEFIREIVANWKILLVAALIPAFILGYNAYSAEVIYPASVTFMVNDEESGGGGGNLASILRTIGGGSGRNENNLEKILQLFTSRRIISNTLFTKTKINGKEDFLANHIIDVYSIEKLIDPYKGVVAWIDAISGQNDFRFMSPPDDSLNNEIEAIMATVLYDLLTGKPSLDIRPLVGSQVDEKSGIMRISVSTIDEDLTLEAVKVLFHKLSSYYIDNTVEKQKKVFEIANFKKDSIERELVIADQKLANFLDSNRKLVWVRGELEQQRLKRQARILEVMYAEVVRQLELSDFALRRRTPYVSFIDMPVKPITPIVKSKASAFLQGAVLGFLFGIFFIVGRKIIRDALA